MTFDAFESVEGFADFLDMLDESGGAIRLEVKAWNKHTGDPVEPGTSPTFHLDSLLPELREVPDKARRYDGMCRMIQDVSEAWRGE